MKKNFKNPAYVSPLRERQKDQTRDLILGAVGKILNKSDLASVTIAAVAGAAEVTERTVYRHFTTRDDLLKAFWAWRVKGAVGDNIEARKTIDEFAQATRRLFKSFDVDEGIMRALAAAPDSLGMRKAHAVQRWKRIDEILAPQLKGLPKAQQRQIAAVVMALNSIPVWMLMRDFCDYDGATAGEAAAQAIEMIVEAARLRSKRATAA